METIIDRLKEGIIKIIKSGPNNGGPLPKPPFQNQPEAPSSNDDLFRGIYDDEIPGE